MFEVSLFSTLRNLEYYLTVAVLCLYIIMDMNHVSSDLFKQCAISWAFL